MISLEGEWQFQLGYEQEAPFKIPFEYTIQIPGILQGQGYGEDISIHTPWVSGLHDPLWYIREEYKEGQENGIHVPFLSQPPKHYLGVAWYQKEIEVEEGFYEFEIECTKWKTEVFLDGKSMGSVTSLCAPHSFELGKITKGSHLLTVKVDNQMQYPYRPDGHGVSDALAASWNGMVGRVCLKKIPDISIQHVVLKPDLESKELKATLFFHNRLQKEKEGSLYFTIIDKESGKQKQALYSVQIPAGKDRQDFFIDCSSISGQWDEYNPDIQTLSIELVSAAGTQKKELCFGFRFVETKEGKFYINHRPSYLRGTHFGGDFPLTGCPSNKKEDWARIFKICKEWGLNFIRFHSYCPPEAAFVAADEVGIYLQVECAMWEVFCEGNGMDKVLWEETERILYSFGHHPSFLMLSPSNEPAGEWAPVLAKWYHKCKELEDSYSSSRLYTRQSGWPYPVEPSKIDNTDYVYFHRSGYGPFPGGTIRNKAGWGEKDYLPSVEGILYPVITHEMGQWCSYPDFDIIEKFTGYLYPGNYKVFKESAKKAHVLSQNKEFVWASGKLQVQMYKEDLEANFRTPHIYGYELLDLHDYLGQGSALVGVLDAFWDNKGYVEAKEFRHFCNETVLLLRIKKRVYTQDESLLCPVELSHFGKEEIKNANIVWQIINNKDKIVKQGSFGTRGYTLSKNQEVGTLKIDLKDFDAPECYTVKLFIEGTEIENSWNIWLYKKEVPLPVLHNAVYTRELKQALYALDQGKKVLYCPILSQVGWNSPYLSERPSFWNSQMGPRWSRGMGLLCNPSHKALRYFPTREYQEYQWNEIIRDAKGINLKEYPDGFLPIVQPLDEWNRNYKMSLLLEAKVGNGSLLLVSSDLERNIENSPVKKQLLYSLMAYVDSEEFSPKQEIQREIFLRSFADTQVMKRLKGKGKLLEYPEVDITAALDGNPNTTFCLEGIGHPYTIELSWETEQALVGLYYMPIQNQREHKGDVREYEVWVWDGTIWEEAAKGEFVSSFDLKQVSFKKELVGTKLRFVAKSGFKGIGQRYDVDQKGWFKWEGILEDLSISVAELAVITKEGVLAFELFEENRAGAKTATIEIEE